MREGRHATRAPELALSGFNLLNYHYAKFGSALLRSEFDRSIHVKAL